MQLNVNRRGDTIIEVMLAFTVFALLAVGTITIMNRGVASAQDALETTLVREQIDAQAETLRFLHQAYLANPSATGAAAVFKNLRDTRVSKTASQATPFGEASCLSQIPDIDSTTTSFLVNPQTGVLVPRTNLKTMSDASAPAYAQLVTTPAVRGYGLWTEALEGGENGQPKFIDFHIRACWYSVTSNAPRTLGTIVRLYVPAP